MGRPGNKKQSLDHQQQQYLRQILHPKDNALQAWAVAAVSALRESCRGTPKLDAPKLAQIMRASLVQDGQVPRTHEALKERLTGTMTSLALGQMPENSPAKDETPNFYDAAAFATLCGKLEEAVSQKLCQNQPGEVHR
jgi:hypothetical protein